MEPFSTFFTEQAGELYHGSFRPRIEKFFQLTHVGSYDCAADRLRDEKLYNPKFKKATKGYVYRVTADISNPGIVKDYYNMPDPGVDSFEKINKWVKDLLKDPRVANSKVTIKGKTLTVSRNLNGVKSETMTNVGTMDIEDLQKAVDYQVAYDEFIAARTGGDKNAKQNFTARSKEIYRK
jgi:hypothetical protein